MRWTRQVKVAHSEAEKKAAPRRFYFRCNKRNIIPRMAFSSLEQVIACTSGYDPDALPVAKANEVIRSFVRPVSGTERLPVRAALGRVLAKDIVSPINVPSHDNSAMDGYAVRGADLSASGAVTLTEIGAAFAGKEFKGTVGAGQCARVMTGAVMPKGTDTVVIQEVAKVEGNRVTLPAGQATGQNR